MIYDNLNIKVYRLFGHIRAECRLCGAYATSTALATNGTPAIKEALASLASHPESFNSTAIVCLRHRQLSFPKTNKQLIMSIAPTNKPNNPHKPHIKQLGLSMITMVLFLISLSSYGYQSLIPNAYSTPIGLLTTVSGFIILGVITYKNNQEK